MNYTDLPVYIRKEGTDAASAYGPVILYDPVGDDNGVVVNNLSEFSGASIQYLESPFTRLSGNASNWAELFVPKVKVTTDDIKNVQVFLPKFRTLRFYNVSNNQQAAGDFGRTFYAFSYEASSNTVNYVDADISAAGGGTWAIRWYGNTDRYSYKVYDSTGPGTILDDIASGNGSNFYSEWKYQNGSNAGVYCSGTTISGIDIIRAINDTSGTNVYYVETNDVGLSDVIIGNATSNSDPASGILYTEGYYPGFDYGAGYVYPHSKVYIGKNYPYLPASNISINYQAQNNGKRLVGRDIDQDDQFSHGTALDAKISFNSYINTDYSGALNTILNATGNDRYTIKFGNSYFSGCNLNNYNISIDPFKPVMLSADFTVYNAPKQNENTQQLTTVVTQVASTNELLYSESVTGSTWNQTLVTALGNQSDPLGGTKATRITSNSSSVSSFDYAATKSTEAYDSITNYSYGPSYSWYSSLGSTTTDKSELLSFTSSKTFKFYGQDYGGVYISNNGYITFGSSYVQATCPNAQGLPIGFNIPLIAAYWRDHEGSSGLIGYIQTSDTLIIEYFYVSLISGSSSFQIHLFFNGGPNAGQIKIVYQSDTKRSGTIPPDAIIGLQKSGAISSDTKTFKNQTLANLGDFSNNVLTYSLVDTPTATTSSIIYNVASATQKLRTFSIYLKRGSGTGDIRYTANGGSTWTIISGVTTSWKRFSFVLPSASHKVGISVLTNGNQLYVFGAQLESLGFPTDYIATSSSIVTRAEQSFSIDKSFYPSTSLPATFANNMINGNTCSLSNIAEITDITQSSIKYSVNCNRTPIYDVGSIIINDIILDTVEKQLDISSTNLPYFINHSGSKLTTGLSITLKDNNNNVSSILNINSGAYILSQKMSIQEGDILMTNTSIKDLVL